MFPDGACVSVSQSVNMECVNTKPLYVQNLSWLTKGYNADFGSTRGRRLLSESVGVHPALVIMHIGARASRHPRCVRNQSRVQVWSYFSLSISLSLSLSLSRSAADIAASVAWRRLNEVAAMSNFIRQTEWNGNRRRWNNGILSHSNSIPRGEKWSMAGGRGRERREKWSSFRWTWPRKYIQGGQASLVPWFCCHQNRKFHFTDPKGQESSYSISRPANVSFIHQALG